MPRAPIGWPLAAALSLLAALPADAQPTGQAVATVAPYLHPCLGIQCTVISGGSLVPLPGGDFRREAHQGPSGATWNTADAIVRLAPAVGLPGQALLQIGVAASLLQTVNLTADGQPGPPLPREQMPLHLATESASFQDRVSFFDPALPLGAPITVSLTWTLATTYCSPTHGNCRVEAPDPGLVAPGAVAAHSNASTALFSRIELPGGTDQASDLRVHSTGNPILPGLVTPQVPGLAHVLNHSFSVLNGSSYLYQLGASADIQFDGASLVDWNRVTPWVDHPVQYSGMLLDYDSTAHLTGLSGLDAQGQPLAGLQLRTSQGWALQVETLSPVPEPATASLWLLACAAWLGRRYRAQGAVALRRLLAVLGLMLAVPAWAQPAPPQLLVQGDVFTDQHFTYSQAAASGTVRGGVQAAHGLGTALSWAESQFGVARVEVESYGHGSAGAIAGFYDGLTIQPVLPAWQGQWGVVEWQFRVTGLADLVDNDGAGFGQLTLLATAHDALPGTGSVTATWSSPIEAGPIGFHGTPLPWLVTVRQSFQFGVAFTIGFELHAVTGTVGQVLAHADLTHTASWQGISQVEWGGSPVAPEDYTLQSLSGTDYRSAIFPVPEPATPLLWLAGAMLLLAARRRKRTGAHHGCPRGEGQNR